MSLIGEKKTELEYINSANKSTAIKVGEISSAPIFEIKDTNKAETKLTDLNEGKSENNSEPKKRSLNQLNDWLKNICKQYGLNEAELIESNILEKISGYNTHQLENIDEKEINRIKKSLITAIQDVSLKKGKKDISSITDLAKDYNIAQIGDWSIDGFKEYNQKNSDSISQRMEEFFKGEFSNKGIKSFDELSTEDKAYYLERYFSKWYENKEISALSNDEKNKIYKLQRQDFTKMLINTKDENKEDVWAAVDFLLSKNKVPGLEALIKSYDSDAIKTKHADTQGTKLIEGLSKIDDFGEYVSGEDVTKGTILISEIQSEEGRDATHEKLNANAKIFFEKNKETLKSIEEKEKDPNAEYTKEELEVKRQRDEYYTAVAAGEIIGTSQNKIISDDFRNAHMQTLVTDAKDISQDNYIRIMSNVGTYVKENQHNLSISEKEFNEEVNKATNNDYSIITKNNSITHTNNTITTQQKTIENETISITQEQNNNNSIQANDVLKNSNEEEIFKYTKNTIRNVNQTGISSKEREYNRQNAIKLLNKLISNNMIQNSKYEGMVLKQLASTSVPTLLNMFLSSNDKTKEYFFKNHLVTPLTIAMNTPQSIIEQLPDNIKENVEEFKA